MQRVAGIEAFGKPGIKPRWTHSNKVGIGTAYSASSHLWFTIWNGIVTEVYFSPVAESEDLEDGQERFARASDPCAWLGSKTASLRRLRLTE
jgi:hypothetical protein